MQTRENIQSQLRNLKERLANDLETEFKLLEAYKINPNRLLSTCGNIIPLAQKKALRWLLNDFELCTNDYDRDIVIMLSESYGIDLLNSKVK